MQIPRIHITLPESLNEVGLLGNSIRGTVASSQCGGQAFSLVPNIMCWAFSSLVFLFPFPFQIVSIIYFIHILLCEPVHLKVRIAKKKEEDKVRVVLLPSMSLWSLPPVSVENCWFSASSNALHLCSFSLFYLHLYIFQKHGNGSWKVLFCVLSKKFEIRTGQKLLFLNVHVHWDTLKFPSLNPRGQFKQY